MVEDVLCIEIFSPLLYPILRDSNLCILIVIIFLFQQARCCACYKTLKWRCTVCYRGVVVSTIACHATGCGFYSHLPLFPWMDSVLTDGQTEIKASLYIPRSLRSLGGYNNKIAQHGNNIYFLPGPRRMTFGNKPLYRAKNLQEITHKAATFKVAEVDLNTHTSTHWHLKTRIKSKLPRMPHSDMAVHDSTYCMCHFCHCDNKLTYLRD